MWSVWSTRTVVIGASTLAFVVVCALPLAYMIGLVLSTPGSNALLDRRQFGLLANTLWLGVGTAILATAIGAPLGFALARIPLRFTSAWRLTLIAPVLLPPYVVALAWTYLDSGAASVLHLGRILPQPHSLAGAIAVLTVVFYPISLLSTEVGLRRLEPQLEEAALLVAPPARTFAKVTGPLVAPHVISAALVIFVLAISEFSVPGLLRVRVFTTEVFTAFAALYDFARATALTVPLLATSLVVASVAVMVRGDRIVTTRRGATERLPTAFATWRQPAITAIVCTAAVTLVAPVTVLAFESLRSASLLSVVAGSRDAALNSLLLAGVGATAVTIVAVGLGYARARAKARAGLLMDVIMVLLFTVPSTITGIGLIGLWNRSGWMGALYGTNAMLVLGYLARFVPVAALGLAASIASVPTSHEEAAAVAGARWIRSMRRIVVPQIAVGLAAVWLLSFILAFGEVGTSILVAPPGESTLPIRVYTLTANAPPGHLAALALFQALVILTPLALLGAMVASRKTQ